MTSETAVPDASSHIDTPSCCIRADGVANLVELLEASNALWAEYPALGTKKDGAWSWITYGQLLSLVDRARDGLAKLGVGRGDRVAIIAGNRVEWAVLAYATYGLGAVYVPMYESQPDKEWEYIIRDSGSSLVICATSDIYRRVAAFAGSVPAVRNHITLEDIPGGPCSYNDLLHLGRDAFHGEAIEPAPDDLAVLIYTSGTTGEPKGVMLTHDNICSNIRGVRKLFPIGPGDVSLAFLPWAHAFGHTCELHALLSRGAAIAICDTVEKIMPYLGEIKPTMLYAVPKIFNRVYVGVQKQMESKPGLIRKLFAAGIAAAKKRSATGSLGLFERLWLWLAGVLIFKKIRAKLGGRLKYAISGGAALAKEVAEFVDALGIAIYEGYGLSETSPIATCNSPGNRRLGSVGKAIAGVRVVIRHDDGSDRDGEIVVYGPNVMKGYWNREAENADVFDTMGGLCTGDMGRFDEDGFLFITGRIKEQYKLENGKYVVPAPLEEQLKLSPYVANVMICGDNKPYNVALIVPDKAALMTWAAAQGIGGTGSYENLLIDARVRALFESEVARLSAEWKSFDRIKRFALLAEDFTQENGMLTPKLSLKRRAVLARWQGELDCLYA